MGGTQPQKNPHITRGDSIASRYHRPKNLNRKLCAAFRASTRENFFARLRKHTVSEAVFAFAFEFLWSIACYFHWGMLCIQIYYVSR